MARIWSTTPATDSCSEFVINRIKSVTLRWQDCSPMQVAQSVSEVLGLQHLLEQSSLVEFIQGFSEAEWTVQDSAYNDTEEENGDCQNDVDKYVPFFCGSLRKKASGALKAIFDRSCSGDSYRQGQ